MTVWTDFVKEYAKKKGLSYGCALSQASADYQASKAGKPAAVAHTKKMTELKNIGDKLEKAIDVKKKRNVTQQGLADLANKAKPEARKQAYLKRVGLPEDLIQEYVDLNYVYYMYDGLEFRRTPKKVKNAVETFNGVLQDVYREITKGNDDNHYGDFFEVDYDGSIDFRDLGFDDEDITWNSDATNYIKNFTTQAKDLLKRIKASRK